MDWRNLSTASTFNEMMVFFQNQTLLASWTSHQKEGEGIVKRSAIPNEMDVAGARWNPRVFI